MNRHFPLVILSDEILQAVRCGLLVIFGVLTLSACQPVIHPPVATTPALTATAPPAPTATLSGFTYGVTVLDGENRPVPNAHILIEIEGQTPLDEYANANDYIRIVVPATHAERPGRLTVNAQGYEATISNIELYRERLTAKVMGNTSGFCPDNLTFATGFAPASTSETLVVVTNFVDTLGNDPRNLTFDLVERMSETLAPHKRIRIERLNCAIKQQGGSETAMRIGSRQDVDANIVIWGVYGEPPDPEVHLYFDIVKEQQTNLGAGFDRSIGPQAIQPSMFDFKASLGAQAGEVVAFAAGLALFNAREHRAAEPLFTTAIKAADQPLAEGFTRALHFYRGADYWQLGRFREAKLDLDLLKPERELASDDRNDLDLSILNALGVVYSDLGNKQQAVDYYNQALPLTQGMGDKAGEAITLSSIGKVYYDLGDNQQAVDYFNQALPLIRAMGGEGGEVTTLAYIGAAYDGLGDKQQALDYYNQVLPLIRSLGDKAGEATTLSNIGGVYDDLGDKQQALDDYNQALSLYRALGDKAGEAETLTHIGGVYADLGEEQQALDDYNQALPLIRSLGDKVGEATTLTNIGTAYHALGEKQQALDYYNQALPLTRAVGDKAAEAATLNNIGWVYSDLGDKQQALDYYNQALPLTRAVGDKAGEATTLSNIGGIYFGFHEFNKALGYVTDAANIQHEIGAAWDEVNSRAGIAVIQQELGNLDAAVESVETAIALATKLNHPALSELRAMLAEINAQRGK